jgi:hypothetical protein
MNLIQRGTTASRANRGKSVKRSIAQRTGGGCYYRNWDEADFTQPIFFAVYPENHPSTHLTLWEQDWKE